MPLTPAQLTTLKAHIVASSDLNVFPNTSDGNVEVAKLLNAAASPSYWVWRSNVNRKDVYYTIPDTGTAFDFATFKAQSVPEQGAWTQMFMGDQADFGNLALRNGVFAVFSGSAAQNAQRAHIFAVGRRLAKRAEKLFAAAPANAGGITVGVNNGNTTGDPLGGTTNPAVMGFEGNVTASEVETARNLP